jgi:hypothetical protein
MKMRPQTRVAFERNSVVLTPRMIAAACGCRMLKARMVFRSLRSQQSPRTDLAAVHGVITLTLVGCNSLQTTLDAPLAVSSLSQMLT